MYVKALQTEVCGDHPRCSHLQPLAATREMLGSPEIIICASCLPTNMNDQDMSKDMKNLMQSMPINNDWWKQEL